MEKTIASTDDPGRNPDPLTVNVAPGLEFVELTAAAPSGLRRAGAAGLVVVDEVDEATVDDVLLDGAIVVEVDDDDDELDVDDEDEDDDDDDELDDDELDDDELDEVELSVPHVVWPCGHTV